MRYGIAVAIGVLLAAAYSLRRSLQDPIAASEQNEGQETMQDPASDQPQEAQTVFTEAADAVADAAADVWAGAVAIFGTRYDNLIRQSADAVGMPYEILWRVLWTESRFRDDIITGAKRSPVGALGIAQFMPATAREWLGSEAAALDPRQAIPGAARYLAWLARQFGGNWTSAVAAYNWGIGNVQRKGLEAAPEETRKYVLSIIGSQQA